jgi:hypothetical protein
MDQPKNAVTMLQRFISGAPIAGPAWQPSSLQTETETTTEAELVLGGGSGGGGKDGKGAAAEGGAAAKKELPRRAMGAGAATA